METGNYIKKRLEESELINLLIDKAKCKSGNLDFFYEVTNVPRTVDFNFDRFYITKEVLRAELSLKPNKKPGDIDILIIPAFKEVIYFQYSSAFELKVVRATNKNFRKNSNSLGTTQTLGLVEDGFPLVGLIQVCMNEPVTPIHLQYLPNLDNPSEIFTFDPFPIYSIENQYNRVLKSNLPKYVGINIFGVSFDQKHRLIMHESSKFLNFKPAYYNPKVSKETIEKIKHHFETNRSQYIEKINNE